MNLLNNTSNVNNSQGLKHSINNLLLQSAVNKNVKEQKNNT